jgi:hypothetical protein
MANTSWHVAVGPAEVTDLCEWGATVEETLGGAGVTTFVIQDRGGVFPDELSLRRQPVLIWLDAPNAPGGVWNLFRGMVSTAEAAAPVGMPWPRYTLSCTDLYNELLDKKILGEPLHLIKADQTGNLLYGNPSGTIGGVWATLARWDPQNTSVYAALAASFGVYLMMPGNSDVVNANPYFEKTTIRGALDTLAGYSGGNTQYWWDADGVFHWKVIPRWWELSHGGAYIPPVFDPDPPVSLVRDPARFMMMFPTYPYDEVLTNLVDADFDGVRGLTWSLDFSREVHRVWVEGGARMTNPNLAIGQPDPMALIPIHGWVEIDPDWGWPDLSPQPFGPPEATLSDDSVVTEEFLARAGARFMKRTYGGILRGKLTLGCTHFHPDGWRVGQFLGLSDERLPPYLYGQYVIIQKVVTKLIPGQDWRIYDLEWGDAPEGRMTSRSWRVTSKEDATGTRAYIPAQHYSAASEKWLVFDNDVVLITGQLVSPDNKPRRIGGVSCSLVIVAYDPNGVLTDCPADAYLDPVVVTTDIMGRWETYLHVGANLGWSFSVVAAGQVPPKGYW